MKLGLAPCCVTRKAWRDYSASLAVQSSDINGPDADTRKPTCLLRTSAGNANAHKPPSPDFTRLGARAHDIRSLVLCVAA